MRKVIETGTVARTLFAGYLLDVSQMWRAKSASAPTQIKINWNVWPTTAMESGSEAGQLHGEEAFLGEKKKDFFLWIEVVFPCGANGAT